MAGELRLVSGGNEKESGSVSKGEVLMGSGDISFWVSDRARYVLGGGCDNALLMCEKTSWKH